MISLKIAVIDDDVRVINSIKMILPELEILEFHSGEDGVEFFKTPNAVSVVLLDIMMPGIDGIATLQQLKKLRPDVAVIIMTAYGSMDIAVQALRNKADDFVEKPFDVQVLRGKIRERLREAIKASDQDDDSQTRVERIKKYIERNYSNVSLNHVADELSLSSRYVSRMFNQSAGHNFRDYKLKIKLDMAMDLLKRTSFTVEQISERLGYMNPESFMRVFKKKIKLTPSEYREQCRDDKTHK